MRLALLFQTVHAPAETIDFIGKSLYLAFQTGYSSVQIIRWGRAGANAYLCVKADQAHA
ncbi:hypothetical protein L1N85_09295 [Paenibacillus alkaliterrae]|uniref:hypothetical protein n=1 Tax=Paenibacillus alkaliterrae TaxID=320909 RepID=UPI001F2726C9|nr:hypothetical protein [Paenibacillus alkaliterrae]MCF2938631.1 hypothetical protein [Paenibacillus alkaliterrae]